MIVAEKSFASCVLHSAAQGWPGWSTPRMEAMSVEGARSSIVVPPPQRIPHTPALVGGRRARKGPHVRVVRRQPVSTVVEVLQQMLLELIRVPRRVWRRRLHCPPTSVLN